MVKGIRPGLGFDLAGMGLGLVPLDKVNVGQHIEHGDVLLGLASSGIHSNGLTLARQLFFDALGWKPDRQVEEFGRTIGEELLEPTRIYVRPILEMLGRLHVSGLANMTGGGLLNLRRFKAAVGFQIEEPPAPPPIFRLIQEQGSIEEAEMRTTFNMGIGFCVILPEKEVEPALQICRQHGIKAWRIGRATTDPERKILLPNGLTLPASP
jgi:phosphoribosylformylglycinamidine cyclo-ligase